MSLLKDGRNCQFCSKPAANILFAAFVCDSEECINKAREQRGGPGGHQLFKECKKQDEH